MKLEKLKFLLVFTFGLLIIRPLFANHCAERLVAIVDPYSTGALLPDAFRRRGWSSIAVKAVSDPGATYGKSFRTQDFAKVFDVEAEGFEAVASRLKALGVSGVIAGAETGVEVADRLNAVLSLPGHDVRLAAARREKDTQQYALGALGIPTKTFRHIEEALVQARAWGDFDAGRPLVIKPARAAGGNGVTFVRNEEELRTAIERILGTTNILNEPNDRFILQRFVDGPEFAVNVVSIRGEHFVTDIWRYKREELAGAGSGYLYDTLLPFEGDPQNALRAYVPKVAAALGIYNGASHFEIKMTSFGPQLIEVAARPCGGGLPVTAQRVSSSDPIAAITNTVCGMPESQSTESMFGYSLRQNAVVVFLSSTGSGRPVSHRLSAEIKKLPGVVDLHWFVSEGEIPSRTTDAGTMIGKVILIGSNAAELERTAETLMRMQKDGGWE